MRKFLLPVLGLPLLLQACAAPKVAAPPPREPADEAGHAADCVVEPNPLAAAPGTTMPVRMILTNDGGWCAVRMRQVASAVLRARPEHGMAYFRNVRERDLTRLQYTPAPGYAGPDSFAFQLLPGLARVQVSVETRAPGAPKTAVGIAAPAGGKPAAKPSL